MIATALGALLLLTPPVQEPTGPQVELRPVPGRELQPQVARGADGLLHLLSLRGDPGAGDLVHRTSADDGSTWSAPRLIAARSATAIGQVRGGHLALGRRGRVHVAWFGCDGAEPRGPDGQTPILYARSADGGEGFEGARNVISSRYGIDGGSSIAADGTGRVWIAWHAPEGASHAEEQRRLWVARSTDDGATWEPERLAWGAETGACACCGVRAASGGGSLYLLYRQAREGRHRGMVLVTSDDGGETYSARELDDWELDQCPLSTAALQPATGGVVAAWERAGAISALLAGAAGARSEPVATTFARSSRPKADLKHPALAVDAQGRMLVAALEGLSWGRPSRVAWTLRDSGGSLLASGPADTAEVPPWSLVAAFSRSGGGFVVLY